MLKVVIQSGIYSGTMFLLVEESEGKKRIILSDDVNCKLIDYEIAKKEAKEIAIDLSAVTEAHIQEPEDFGVAEVIEKFMAFYCQSEYGLQIIITKFTNFVRQSDRTIKRGLATYRLRFIHMGEIIEISSSEHFLNSFIRGLQQ